MERLGQVLWLLEYRADVASDMSVFHRISYEEVERMPAGTYFALARRLPAYAGALQSRLAQLQKPAAAPSPNAPTRPAGPGVMPGTRTAIQASEFADLFSWGGG